MMILRLATMILLTIPSPVIPSLAFAACFVGREGHPSVNSRNTLLESVLHGPIVLRPEGVRSVLHPANGLAQVSPGQVLRRAAASRRLLLLLWDLRAAQTPETLFHVYLNLPEQADQATRRLHLLAQFNFFTAARPHDTTTPVWQSVDITQVVGTLVERGMVETEATLTIVAAQTFDPKSQPTIGRFAIVTQ